MSEKLCPRARRNIVTATRFLVAEDPALWAVAQMIVAGIDRKYSLHPRYKSYVDAHGEKMAQSLIRSLVEVSGVDVIQTDPCLGGVGLYGGLSEDGKEFIFYEWTTPWPKLRVHVTHQEARDIVSGQRKFATFVLCSKEHFIARRLAREKLLSR